MSRCVLLSYLLLRSVVSAYKILSEATNVPQKTTEMACKRCHRKVMSGSRREMMTQAVECMDVTSSMINARVFHFYSVVWSYGCI